MKELQNTTRDIARELARKYSTMTHEELDTLESILVPKRYSKGEMILKEGEVCENIYYIDKGLVRQFYFKKEKQLTEHIGSRRRDIHVHRVSSTKNPLICKSRHEPSAIYLIPKHRLEQVALHNVNIQILYRKILEESLIISQQHADLLRFETAQNRYLRLCKIKPQVVLRAPLVYIASYLQMTPETLSRVRAASI